MLALTSSLGLSPDDIENRIYFMKVVESLLKPFFGEIKMQIFGSTLNGFGFKGCDLDMSFETFTEEIAKVKHLSDLFKYVCYVLANCMLLELKYIRYFH